MSPDWTDSQERAAIAEVRNLVRGDTVRIVAHILPKYLIGVEGTVTKVIGGRVGVRLNDRCGRFPAGYEADVHAVCVQQVSA